jgi:hypothetical protein
MAIKKWYKGQVEFHQAGLSGDTKSDNVHMMESFFESDTGRKLVFDGENWVERHTIDPGIDINGGSVINAATVTPSDTTDLDAPSKWLYIGVSGNLEVILTGGQTVIFRNLAVGFYPICATRIKAAETTALNIIAGW